MHSAPFSEFAAHACGLAAGIAAYAISGYFTADHAMRMHVGKIVSVICNAIIGGKINLLMKDFFSLIVIRPISAYLGTKLFAYVVHTAGW